MPERLAELLAVRAVAGLSSDEARELGELLAEHPEVDERDYELAMASLRLAPLPESLRERLLRRATRDSLARAHRRWWIAAGVLAGAMLLAVWSNR